MCDHNSVSLRRWNAFHSSMAGHALPEGDQAAHKSVQDHRQGCQQQWQFSSSSDAKQPSRTHQSDWMTSARLELWNPQMSLTFLNQVLFTVKQWSAATQQFGGRKRESQKVHCPQVTRAGKPHCCNSLLNHAIPVIFLTLNCFAKEQEKSNRK